MSDTSWPVVGRRKLVGQGSLNEWRKILGRCGWFCQIARELVVCDIHSHRSLAFAGKWSTTSESQASMFCRSPRDSFFRASPGFSAMGKW